MDPLAHDLWRKVEVRRGSRVRAGDLLDDLVAVRPELAADAGRWALLRDAIDALVDANLVTPARRTVVHAGVILPSMVSIVGRTASAPRHNPARDHAWSEVMRWAASARLTSDQFDKMKRLNAWLATAGERPLVPVRERSLEVFGDDKVLDTLLKGLLAPPGRCPEALRVEAAHPPVAAERVHPDAGGDILIVENGTTFRSALRALRVHHDVATVDIGWVAYGAGSQLATIIPSVLELEPAPTRLWYFGDLDPNGLRIPAQAAVVCAEEGMPPLLPHRGLYERLLRVGCPQTRKVAAGWPEQGLAWLGPELSAATTTALASDQWLAQEWVGYERLLVDRAWTVAT